MGSESPASSKDLPYESSVPSDQQDMLEYSSLATGSPTSLPGCASLAGEVNPVLEDPWMAMKRKAILSVLNRPASYARGLPDYMPGSLSRSVQDMKMKGKQTVRDCSPLPPSQIEHPVSPKTKTPGDRIVHLVSRVSGTYQSPYPLSSEKGSSVPPSSKSDESTIGPMSPRHDAPPAFKRSRIESDRPFSPLNTTDYLDLSPSQIDELLHEGKEFPTRFIYNAEQLNEIAHCCLIDLIDFFNFYAPGSPQEASARVHLVTRHQGHFNAFLKAAKL
ncbi:uncharacterized protein PGTG_15741 [Puccinia graminis f. sp. tritici CRL 75-36-700-3]|uniref:Uncharacterized protein n=1 Tax=Puccinia graminis f. sp. tritici (strain CRL 75-36-700-3 / race SCCL) TaxID=418459 RepID=E3KZ67_PUCGT|nr:uncharacterized protein PGTG_15741 [Puccinia graminis f. sp. tritici CRL 75-36-700-3]EFP89592.1 hypothetical protein PGTG_15741 [Puccinia graminis f. sp. tritici CRL 75-36-700-3]